MPTKTIGFSLPSPFPGELFDDVNLRISNRLSGGIHPWREFSGGWNAVAYRLRATQEHDVAFRSMLVTPGGGWDRRFHEENTLFGFFTSGVSCLDAFCYATYAVGHAHRPIDFPMTSSKDLRSIGIERTTGAVERRFPGSSLALALRSLVGDDMFKQWIVIRNVLVHRLSPGRTIFLSAGVPFASADLWIDGLAVDDRLTGTRGEWLTPRVSELVSALHVLVMEQLT